MKRLNIYNYKGYTEKDNDALEKAIAKGYELYIDEYDRVFINRSEYIADVYYVADGDGIGC